MLDWLGGPPFGKPIIPIRTMYLYFEMPSPGLARRPRPRSHRLSIARLHWLIAIDFRRTTSGSAVADSATRYLSQLALDG